ncbi:MAG: hypothetical protein IJW05_05400 [Lentisphaeria bacterium]|nr:hypothetical protein [Lentisphaeria bacterium]
MGKGAISLTNSLYKINDKIAQATNSASLPGVPEVPAQQKNVAEKEADQKVQKLSPERIQEFNRMHHDLEIRIEGMISEYQAEMEIHQLREKELSAAAEQVNQLKKELASLTLPEETSGEQEKALSKTLRALELMRLETIRMTKKLDSGKTGSASAAGDQKREIDLMNLPNSEIVKKGFVFFFPLFLALLFCTVLMGLAFIFAWKVAL